MFKDLIFSDIILMTSSQAYLKGTPDLGSQLKLITHEMIPTEELNDLLLTVEKEFNRQKSVDPLLNLRIIHNDVAYRVASYQDVKGKAYFLRRLADSVPDFTALGLNLDIAGWLLAPAQQKGLVLFCGAQASGKTTAASSLVASRLRVHGGHAITFERPVEMPLSGKQGLHGLCFQTEIRTEQELARYIEISHRLSSPNIVFAGEITNKYTASEVLKVAMGSSNQLVVSTIHGLDVITALDRLLSMACELDGDIACQNLSQCLLAILFLELKVIDNKNHLTTPQFMLVPFIETAKGIRAKIRENKLTSLANDITEQKNKLQYSGIGAIIKEAVNL